jgi:hypothetical protein
MTSMKWMFGLFLHRGIRVKRSRTLTLFLAKRPKRPKRVSPLRLLLESPQARA